MGNMKNKAYLLILYVTFRSIPEKDWGSADTLEGICRTVITMFELNFNDAMMVLRIALTGKTASPPNFTIMTVLGKKECMERIELLYNEL